MVGFCRCPWCPIEAELPKELAECARVQIIAVAAIDELTDGELNTVTRDGITRSLECVTIHSSPYRMVGCIAAPMSPIHGDRECWTEKLCWSGACDDDNLACICL